MRPPESRTGFSLVLSLAVMALLVLIVLSLAGFLSLESRAATARLASTQGRLAAMASLRLAIAHLQQEAGADRRVTARADLTADATQSAWTWATIRNPLWTGVWRTDIPQQPPSWLISGRHDRAAGSQSVSLSGASDYGADQWLPWQATAEYSTNATGALPIPLVGDSSATPHELATATDPGRPDGRITLPRVSAPDAGGFGYAYWVGDEGVKARANLHDPRHATGTSAHVARGMLTASGRAGINAVAGFESLTPDFALLSGLLGHTDLGLPELAAKGHSDAAPTGLPSTSLRHRRHRHDLSFWSQGLLVDSFWGGLKVDLSQAFEMSDAEFLASEFGEGKDGATLLFYEMNRTTRALPPVMQFQRGQKIWMPIWVPRDLTDAAGATPFRYDVAPLYTHNWHDPDDSTRGYVALRGPTWLLLRDHHRLFKQVEWPSAANPTLRARTFWPNVVQNERMQPGVGGTFHYSHIFNRMDIPNNGTVRSDPFVNDLNGGAFQASAYSLSSFAARNGSLGSGCPSIKPVRVAATPYISRVAVVFGLQQSGGAMRLVCTPVVVLHNPFNVSMALRRMNATDSAAARLSFRWWNSWIFDFAAPDPLGAWNRSLLDLARLTDSTSSATESLRTYIPETTLAPGEFRIFTPPATQPIPFARVAATENRYDFNGGFWLSISKPGGGTLATSDNLTSVGLRPQGAFYIRHLMTSWPGDSIMEPATGWDGIYNRSSEHTELFDSEMNAARNGTPGVRTFPSGFAFPAPGSPPQIFAVIDYSVRWPRDPLPYPIMTHSNPLAMMTRGDANGYPPTNPAFGTTYATSSPSYRLNIRSPNTWGEAFEAGDGAGQMGLGGLSNSSGLGGQTSAVLTAVPLRAPQSLAEYAHANLTMRDQDPLFTIGSGFASPNIPLDKVVHYRPTENWTDADRTYLANMAVWDRYFLSSISPEVAAAGSSATRSLQQVLDDFLAGSAPLANPRMQLWRGRDAASPTVRADMGDWNKVSGHLVVDGAFNVNSTSVDAWTAVLAATRGVPNGGDSSADTRFPRTERAGASATASPRSPFANASSWTGFSDLSDDQIRLLARCIVDEIRFRTQFAVRTPVDRQINKSVNLADERQFRGATSGTRVRVPTPFLGLSQFVNRFLDTSAAAPGTTTDRKLAQAKAGCLQAAIARAEAEGGQLSNRTAAAPSLDAVSLGAADKGAGQQSWSANPAGIETIDAGSRLRSADAKSPSNQTHAALFAPGSLLQQDILAAIGSHISARSDTFVIRAYGDIRGQGGETRGRAWIEAVVQRTPDHCVAVDAPDADPDKMLPVNRQLGRRFRVVSARWLRPDEI